MVWLDPLCEVDPDKDNCQSKLFPTTAIFRDRTH